MREKCGTAIPSRDEDWNVCLASLLQEALQFFDGMISTTRAIENDESRLEICREWVFRVQRYHAPSEFDALISEVAADIGRGDIDPLKIRRRFYEQWTGQLALLNPGYDFAVEGRKLIEQTLLSALTPVLPVTGKDIMEAFGLAPGPKIGELLEKARLICGQQPCTREFVLGELRPPSE
jgi:hypothetical protein